MSSSTCSDIVTIHNFASLHGRAGVILRKYPLTASVTDLFTIEKINDVLTARSDLLAVVANADIASVTKFDRILDLFLQKTGFNPLQLFNREDCEELFNIAIAWRNIFLKL